MPALIRGELPLADYVALLRNLQAIYAELEGALRLHAGHPCIALLPLAPLWRSTALARDLATLDAGDAPRPLVFATAKYTERLRAHAASDPALLVAHVYVRYLGDLSGGQVLARVLARTHALPAGSGTAFYDFGASPRALADALRAAIDDLPLDERSRCSVIEEACTAFIGHVTLFEQLASP
jgi:heme oxygenase